MRYVGLIVNPIAGMGGRVGLKGTDGADILAQARALGSVPEAPAKAQRALAQLEPIQEELTFLVAAGEMGETIVKELGYHYEVIYTPDSEDTQAEDTYELAQTLKEREVDLILFVGGDGTARDLTRAIGTAVPVIGAPAGVKIHSPVYGHTPESAGKLALSYLQGNPLELREEEVMDIEEEAFRQDHIQIAVYGYLQVPYDERHLQNLKSPSPQSDKEAQESAALYIIDQMDPDTYYVIGSGTTTARIMEELNLDHTILGVDIIKDGELIVQDASEAQILETVGDHPFRLVVTLMGGQGYLFGRGNQQLSANVLSKIDRKDVIVISTPGKLQTLGQRPLLVYTMDDAVDEAMSGYYRIITGYGQIVTKKATSLK